MFLTILAIILYSDLNFDGLTITNLLDWYCQHPFWAMLAIGEIIRGLKITVNNKSVGG